MFHIFGCVFFVPTFCQIMIIIGCFEKIHLSTSWDESNVRVGTLCSAAASFSTSIASQSLWSPCETRKSQFIYKWMRTWSSKPELGVFCIFLSELPATLQCYAERDRKSRFCSRLNFRTYWLVRELVQSTYWARMIPAKSFAIPMPLLILLPQKDIVDWVQFTFNTTCFSQAKLGETLSSKTNQLFSSSLCVMWFFKSVRLVHNWAPHQR